MTIPLFLPRTLAIAARRRLRGIAALAVVAAWFAPCQADDLVNYGFRTIDNSSGGSVLDHYVSQVFWAETELRWLGTQLRLELDHGTIFQRELDGTGFIAEANHNFLATIDPAIAFDTRIGLNGLAPGSILNGAPDIGGSGLRFTDTEIDIAYGPGGGNVFSGSFDFGTFTLSDDAMGRGALLLSSSDLPEGSGNNYGYFARLLEVDHGTIRLTGEEIPLVGRNVDPVIHSVNLTSNYQLEVRFNPDRLPLNSGNDPGVPPADRLPFGELIPYLPEFVELSGANLRAIPFSADSDGAISAPLEWLTDEAVTNLVASGNWSVRGDNLVFAAGGGAIPEPGSITLAMITAVGAALWWGRRRS